MITAENIQLVTALLGVIASIIAAIESRLIKRMVKAEATSPESAIELSSLGSISRWKLNRLQKIKAIGVTSHSKYYLDESHYKKLRTKRRKIVLSIVLPCIAAILIISLWMM